MRLPLPILALLGTLLLAGCHRSLSPVEEGNRTGTLLLGNGTEPSEIDPHLTIWDSDSHITSALFEGLVELDPVTMQPLPATADAWMVSPDGLVYTFHIRPSARWSNGDPVTSDDFLYAARRILSPGLASEHAYLHFMVKGAQDYATGKLSDFSQTGYKAPDPATFQVTLAHPVPYFLYLLTGDPWFPVHRATIEKFGKIDERGTRWTMPGNLVGNGPFALKAWRVNEVIEVGKNPFYWDAANVGLNAIKFLPIEDNEAEVRAFRSGQLHVTATMPLSKIPGYREHYPAYFHTAPILVSYFYLYNVTKPPFDKAGVRRALAMAVDREGLVGTVLRAGQVPAYSVTPPHMGGYDAGPARFSEDVAEARKALAQAGYPDGKGFPKVELLYNTSEGHRRIAEAIQQMWKKNLNIDVTLFNQETKVYDETLKAKRYQVARMGWGGGYFDPTAFLDMFTSDNENNYTGWASPEYDGLLKQASTTADPAARMALLRKAENLLVDEMPLIPIYFYTRSILWRPEVKGWYLNLLEDHPYKYIRLDPAAAGPARLRPQ